MPIVGAAAAARPSADFAEWVLVHIPLGTVYAEEQIFRATLDPLLGPAIGAATFGLWHIHPARVAGDNVVVTVVATAAAGLAFDWLATRYDTVAAPALAHLAINVAGAAIVGSRR
jgi:membrane protease YdiL (CAAX protease family)